MVGAALARSAAGRFEVTGSFFGRPVDHEGAIYWDLRQDIPPVLDRIRPHLIVHTAALSAPARCERQPEDAWHLHSRATGALAQWARRHSAYLLFLSTDLVFDGRKGRYTETDAARPRSVYGRTKREGETACLSTCPSSAFLRPALIYGHSRQGDRGADEQICRTLTDGRSLHLFFDEFRTPLWLEDLVRVLLYFLERRPAGLYHVGGPHRLSRWEFGCLVARSAGLPLDRIHRVSLSTYSGSPPRCADVSLDCVRLKAAIPFALHSPEQVLFHENTR